MAINQITIAGTVGGPVQSKQQDNGTIHYFLLSVPWLDRDKNLGAPTQIQCFARSQFNQTLSPGTPVIVTGNLRVYKNPQRKDPYVRIDFSYGAVEVTGTPTSINMLCLAGNIGKEPETKYRENSPTLTKFSIAIKTGQDATDWHDIVLWGKRAESAQKCLHKGSKVTLTGILKEERWADKTDQSPRARFNLTASNFALQGGSNNQSNDGQQQSSGTNRQPAYTDDAC